MKNNTELNEDKNKNEIRHLSLEDHGSRYQMMEKCLHDLEILLVIGGSTMEDDKQDPPKRCVGLGGPC